MSYDKDLNFVLNSDSEFHITYLIIIKEKYENKNFISKFSHRWICTYRM